MLIQNRGYIPCLISDEIMVIHQFYDKGLAHLSYAIISGESMVVIDPARDPEPYYIFAEKFNVSIQAVIETHLHADFVSSHLEIAKTTGAQIYISRLAEAEFKHTPFDEGNSLQTGDITLEALNTPGHSPESICILLYDEEDKPYALFTGDTLFVGDVGRPDLRENNNEGDSRESLADVLYHSIHKILSLPENILIYPAHGAGSLCGKNIGPELFSDLGKEKRSNAALQKTSQASFINDILDNQSFIPKYFPFDVLLNKKGADDLQKNTSKVPVLHKNSILHRNYLVIDSRSKEQFKSGHVKGAINIQLEKNFESWLGSIVSPDEKFYLITEDETSVKEAIKKTAKIGYETNVLGVLLNPDKAKEINLPPDVQKIKNEPEGFTFVDVRNKNEVANGKIFHDAIHIPLQDLRKRMDEIPTTRPIVVHCAAGNRSSTACSLIEKYIQQPVIDLGENIKEFQNGADGKKDSVSNKNDNNLLPQQ
jgi:hydroxyacylglutathione hydrolase